MTDTIQNVTEILEVANDDVPEMLMSNGGYIAAAVTLFFIGFFGFFLNLCVIILLWKEKQVSSVLFSQHLKSFLIIHLSIS